VGIEGPAPRPRVDGEAPEEVVVRTILFANVGAERAVEVLVKVAGAGAFSD